MFPAHTVVKYLGGNNGGLASVTLNRNLCITVLRELLVEGADHSVELWEGTGASWKVARYAGVSSVLFARVLDEYTATQAAPLCTDSLRQGDLSSSMVTQA
jgi:hypothetical protein